MIITLLQQQKRRVDYVNLFIDEQFWLSLHKNQLLELQLFKGKEIHEDEKKNIEDLANNNKVLEKVKNYIGIRPRSKKEVMDYLIYRVGAGHCPTHTGAADLLHPQMDIDIRKSTISQLENLGLIDDERFTDWYVRQRMEFGLHGPKKIEAELIKKGISRDLIHQTLEKYNEDEELGAKREEKLKDEIKKLKKSVKAKNEKEQEMKIIRKLMGKGYNYATIKKLIRI